MNINGEQNAFLHDVALLIQFIENSDNGMLITGGELFRTTEQEQIYVNSGRSNTINSNHLRRLAIDLNFIQGGKIITDKQSLLIYGDFWESLNPLNRAGMNFTTIYDPGHFERNVV
jgi:hypothetical protein